MKKTSEASEAIANFKLDNRESLVDLLFQVQGANISCRRAASEILNQHRYALKNSSKKVYTTDPHVEHPIYMPSCRDYNEDFLEENGNYVHTCRKCSQLFLGNKRRPSLCKACNA